MHTDGYYTALLICILLNIGILYPALPPPLLALFPSPTLPLS